MALTLAQLLRHTPAYVQKGSRNTKILNAKVVRMKQGGYKKLKAEVLRVSNDGVKHNKHKLEIMSLTPGPDGKLSKGPVKVSCDCEAFLYWGIEYVLHQHGAADIKYGNGEPPTTRNPAQVIFLCPHLTKMALACIRENL